MRLAPLFPLALLAVNVLAPALAEHSASVCSQVESVGAGAATLYLVHDAGDSKWLYVESNGHPGLQQGGAGWWEPAVSGFPDDRCWDREIATGEPIADPDTILL